MAYVDYMHCDLCDAKVFYDANLNYDDKADELVRDRDYSLDRLGDWRVLCRECAKTHETVIRALTVDAPQS